MAKNNSASGYLSSPVSLTQGLPVRVGSTTTVVPRGSVVHHVTTDPANPKAHVMQPDGKIRTLTVKGEKFNSRADQIAIRRRHFSNVVLESEKKK